MKKYIYWVLFLFFCFAVGYSFKFFADNETGYESEIRTPLAKTEIKFENDVFDFGKIEYSKEVTTYFVYENIGENNLKIDKILSSCGCTVPVWSKDLLKSGMKDSVLVVYDAEKKGKFSKNITIVYNGIESPKDIRVKGIVYD